MSHRKSWWSLWILLSVYTSYHKSAPFPGWCGSFRTVHLLFGWPGAAKPGLLFISIYQYRHIGEILLWRTGKGPLPQFLSCSLLPLKPETVNPANDTAIEGVLPGRGISCCLLLVIATSCYLNITQGRSILGRFGNHTFISLWGLATLSWKKRPQSFLILLKGTPLALKFYLSFILGALA